MAGLIKKQIIPLPFQYYFIPTLLIAFIGLSDSIYLALSHYRVYTDIGYKSFCAISRAINCDTVSQSPYSIFLGVPVPIWGIIGYVFILVLFVFAGLKSAIRIRVWTVLVLLSAIFSVYSLALAAISIFFIHSYCIMCILSYGVNLSLLYFSWLIRNRFSQEPYLDGLKSDIVFLISKKIIIPIGFIFFIGVIAVPFVMPKYWLLKPPALSNSIPTGVTSEGYPWIGAENPVLSIEEFSDYYCFQCKKMHFYLRQLIEKFPDRIRLVHRHFPMDKKINPIVDRPFHEGSAKLSLLAIYATEKGKFWKMNDVLFTTIQGKKEVNLKSLAEKAGLEPNDIVNVLRNNKFWVKLGKDIKAGLDYGLIGTPGFIIDGKVYQAQIPPEILNKALK